MMNRRQLMGTGAAALFASIPKAHAATYDLLIKGGRVIDPSVGLDAIRDVAMAAGKIVAVEADIAGDASQTIDARGKIVAPGLIDIHTHAGRSKEGPPLALQDGVTGWIDGRTGGAGNFYQNAPRARAGTPRARPWETCRVGARRRAGSCTPWAAATWHCRKERSPAIAISSSAS